MQNFTYYKATVSLPNFPKKASNAGKGKKRSESGQNYHVLTLKDFSAAYTPYKARIHIACNFVSGLGLIIDEAIAVQNFPYSFPTKFFLHCGVKTFVLAVFFKKYSFTLISWPSFLF